MKKIKPEITLPSSLLIDPRAEPLQTILTPYRGITHVPSEITGPALMVFIELQKCFKKADKVSEGLLANVIWGFEQCGYDQNHTAAGLSKLRELGYIHYSDAGGQKLSVIQFDPQKPIWIRYSKKMVDLFVRNNESGRQFQGD